MRILGIIIRNISLASNILAVILLLLGWINSKTDTSLSPNYLSLIAFILPFLIIINLGFIFFWIIFTKKKWFALLSLIALIFTYPVSKNIIGIHLFGADKNNTKKESVKIMTYNLHLFDLGEWTKDKTTQRKIMDFLKEQNADILCFQEYYVMNRDDRMPFTEIITNLGYGHYYFVPLQEMKKSRITIQSERNEKLSSGLAVFSKFPISNMQSYDIGKPHYKALKVDVNVNNNYNFSLIVTHLQSFRFGKDDRAFIDNAKEDQAIIKDNTNVSKNILQKIVAANAQRAVQANNVNKIIKDQKLPVIICGDLNDVPGSYVYTKISEDLQDAFESKGFGLGRTFRYIFPTLRIDHIFYNKEYFSAVSYKIPNVTYSDHKPVIAELEFQK